MSSTGNLANGNPIRSTKFRGVAAQRIVSQRFRVRFPLGKIMYIHFLVTRQSAALSRASEYAKFRKTLVFNERALLTIKPQK